MTNIFNDLNKLVNTVQKVDKLLSEKPKTQYITKRFTEKEIDFLYSQLCRVEDFEHTDEEWSLLTKLKRKLE
jgi:hypothetical protein